MYSKTIHNQRHSSYYVFLGFVTADSLSSPYATPVTALQVNSYTPYSISNPYYSSYSTFAAVR